MPLQGWLQVNEKLSKYQLYRHLPNYGWTLLGVNVHPLKEGNFFDLLLYSPGKGKLAVVLANRLRDEGIIEIPPIVANSLSFPEIAQLYEAAVALMSQKIKEIKSPNTFLATQSIKEIQSLAAGVNPFRRSVLGMTDLVNEVKSIQRYRDVASLIRRQNIQKAGDIRILDSGCSVGYGSIILSEIENSEVLGIDSDYEAIELANMFHLGNERVSFQHQSLENKAKEPERFSYIVSLETMEHVDDPQTFLRQALELLEEDGLLFISVPHWRFHGSDLNSDHRTNWSLEKFVTFLRKHSEIVQILASEIFTIDRVFSDDPSFKEVEAIPRERIEHLLAVVSKKNRGQRSLYTVTNRQVLKILFINHSIPPYEYTGTPIPTTR